MKNVIVWIIKVPQQIVLRVIKVYQKTISPDHGVFRHRFPYGYCQFHPSCSMYSYGAIERFGLLRGGVMTCWRLLRCHPLSKGGIDPVPSKKKKNS